MCECCSFVWLVGSCEKCGCLRQHSKKSGSWSLIGNWSLLIWIVPMVIGNMQQKS